MEYEDDDEIESSNYWLFDENENEYVSVMLKNIMC